MELRWTLPTPAMPLFLEDKINLSRLNRSRKSQRKITKVRSKLTYLPSPTQGEGGNRRKNLKERNPILFHGGKREKKRKIFQRD